MTKLDKDKRIISKAFDDERIPASLQHRAASNSTYKKREDFDIDLDERPIR